MLSFQVADEPSPGCWSSPGEHSRTACGGPLHKASSLRRIKMSCQVHFPPQKCLRSQMGSQDRFNFCLISDLISVSCLPSALLCLTPAPVLGLHERAPRSASCHQCLLGQVHGWPCLANPSSPHSHPVLCPAIFTWSLCPSACGACLHLYPAVFQTASPQL